MPTLAVLLVVWVVGNIAYQWFLVGRVRPTKSVADAAVATVELGLVAWAVIALTGA